MNWVEGVVGMGESMVKVSKYYEGMTQEEYDIGLLCQNCKHFSLESGGFECLLHLGWTDLTDYCGDIQRICV